MPDKKTQAYRPLYCIVTMPADPSQLKPDMGMYSPKELAAKENTSTTSVYSWIDQGLPVMRRGDKGNILIHYQDYIQWMIDCAYQSYKGSLRDEVKLKKRVPSAARFPKKRTARSRPSPTKDSKITMSPLGHFLERCEGSC